MIIKNSGPRGGQNLDPALCGETPLSFASVNTQIFIRNCTVNGCHSGASLNFTTYEGVTGALVDVKSAVLGNRMPPRGPLPFADKAMLLSWINQGAPRNEEDADMTCAEPEPQPPALAPTYVALREGVFAQNCLGCHGVASPLGDFTSYEGITAEANMRIFDLENPANSELVKRVVTTDPDAIMPPPRTGLAPLSPEVIAVITEWIAKGLPKE